jgi:hypothetical protein
LGTPHLAFVYFGDFENLTILLHIGPDTVLGKHAGMVRYPIQCLSQQIPIQLSVCGISWAPTNLFFEIPEEWHGLIKDNIGQICSLRRRI